MLVAPISKMAHNIAENQTKCLFQLVYKFIAATPCTKVIDLSFPFETDGLLAFDRHAANRVNCHDDSFLELSILKP